MNNDDDFKFSAEVVDALVSATNICYVLAEKDLSTLDVVIAAIMYEGTKLYDFLNEEEGNVFISPEEIVLGIASEKRLYEKIIGKDYDKYLKIKRGNVKRTELIPSLTTNGVYTIVSAEVPSLQFEKIIGNLDIGYDQELLNAMEEAQALVSVNNKSCIDLDLLLYCILKKENSSVHTMLNEFFNTEGLLDYISKDIQTDKNGKLIPDNVKTFVTNITEKILKKSKCDILGRKDELFELWNIISKKTKRNAILIGEPGVGKTAIIEAMTYDIIHGNCPEQFKNYAVYSLDLNAMVAGTKYRGEFEEKVQKFVDFVMNNDNIIVFIDEIHQILGTGKAEGSGPDLVGALKPVLARDNIVLIGATTTDEYNRIFSRDGALNRRFEIVEIEEPKLNKVKQMIASRVETLSNFHKVTIDNKVLDKVLIYASSFSNVANPDRTIDLVDKTMAVAKLMGDNVAKEEHIKMVYNRNFKKYTKISKKQNMLTAYHEAGHFAMWLLSKTKRNEDCILVSIVPAQYWAGVTIFEENEVKKYSRDMNYLKDCIAIDLAGRISQSFVDKNIDAGASSDLRQAISMAEKFIMEYGIFDEYKNYTYSSNTNLNISDKNADKIREITIKLVNEVYERTEKILIKNIDGIKRVAELLEKEGIITGKQAKNAFYNKNTISSKSSKVPETVKK